jgi:alpha-1,6-mannosyltransferase
MNNQKAVLVSAAVLSLAGYIYLGYFAVRSNFVQIILPYAFVFGLYLLMLRGNMLGKHVKLAVVVALLFRLVLLFMTPNLTDDYFRYIWDGLSVADGHNPYLLTPSALMQGTQAVPGAGPALYAHLNSPDYYSVYPPLCQYLFGLSAALCGADVMANVILLRILILLAECGSIWLLFRISGLLKVPQTAPFIYALNPLVIIELNGNLHPEALMIFFLLLAIYLLLHGRNTFSALAFACAVGVKLIPLIFLPLLIKRLGIVNSVKYFLVTGSAFVLLSAPFLSWQALNNFVSGLSLYFRLFEFNASLYYLVRWVGYAITGYNMIAVAGAGLAAVSAVAIVAYAIVEKGVEWGKLLAGMLFCLTVYLLCATTVHPWYLTTLIALSALTRYRYGLVWSLLIILSYASYQTLPYSENLYFVAAEYVLVGMYMGYEIIIKRKLPGLEMESNRVTASGTPES